MSQNTDSLKGNGLQTDMQIELASVENLTDRLIGYDDDFLYAFLHSMIWLFQNYLHLHYIFKKIFYNVNFDRFNSLQCYKKKNLPGAVSALLFIFLRFFYEYIFLYQLDEYLYRK